MKVVGVDYSMTSTGVAITGGHTHRVTSKGKADDSLTARQHRLMVIAGRIEELAEGADLVVIEGPSYSSKGAHTHDRSGGWWLVVANLIDQGHLVVEVPPALRMTYATGRGNARKDQVLAETVKRYPDWDVSGNDIADALVLCALGCDWAGHPLVELPQTHRRALAKIAWPASLAVAS